MAGERAAVPAAELPSRSPLLAFDRRDAALLTALFLLATLAFSGWLFAPENMAPGMPDHDAQTQWHLWRAFAFDEIRQGRLPLWNPYILCGTPFLGNFQSAMFYPPNLIFLIPNVALAARLSILLHLWLSLLFSYLLARLLRCGRTGSAVAAISFTFCAAQWLRIPAGHWGVSTAIPWLPLILFCVEWQFLRPGRAPVIVGALAIGMQILAGVPQYVFISAVAVGLYALLRGVMDCGLRIADCGMPDGGAQACPERQSKGPSAFDVVGVKSDIRNQKSEIGNRPSSASPPALSKVEACLRGERVLLVGFGGLVLIYLLGAAIAAVQLVPGLEAAANGARGLPMDPQWVQLFSLGPENLLTMVVPGLFGGAEGMPYWGRFYFWEMNAYIGIVALALVVAAFFLVKPRRRTLLLGIPALMLLLLALGKHTPLMGWLDALIPFGKMLRGSSKFLMPFSLMLALLAGMGAQAVIENELRPRWRLLVVLVASIALGGIGLYLIRYHMPVLWRFVARSGESFYPAGQHPVLSEDDLFMAAGQLILVVFFLLSLITFKARSTGRYAAVLLIVALDMMVFSLQFAKYETDFYAPSAGWRSAASQSEKSASGATIRTSLFDSLAGDNWAMIDRQSLTAGGIEPNPPVRYHTLLCEGMGWPVNVARSVYSLELAPYWLLANVADSTFRPIRCTRAMLLFQARIAATPEEALVRLLVDNPDPANVVILEDPSVRPMESDIPGKSCPIVAADSDNVTIECDAERDGWLVLRDNYFPGWVATVDGVETPIEVANFSFRAVPVPPGRHVVKFSYCPASFRIGLGLSLIGLLICAGLGAERLRRRLTARAQ